MNLMPGDIGFSWHPHLLGLAIAQVTHAKISHVELIVDVGVNGTLYTMSAEAEGLIPRWVIPEDQPWYQVLTIPELTLRQRDDLCDWAWKHKGVGYDVWGLASFVVNLDLNNEQKVFCSEAVFLNFQEAVGINIIDGVDHAFVSPRDLWISPLLKTLDSKPKEVR